MIKSIHFIFLFSILSCFVTAQNITYHTIKDIPYRIELDLYYPEQIKDFPVIVWFHGGGLSSGNKFVPEELKESGLGVVSVNYRLLPKGTLADCIDDAAAATAWVFQNIANYGGDPQKIFVSGHSAGGYLTNMIGLDKKWLRKYNIEFAPLYYVRPDAPPLIIVSGDRELEMLGRYEENAYFWRMMKVVGHKQVYIYELGGHDHGAMVKPAFHILKNHVKRILDKK